MRPKQALGFIVFAAIVYATAGRKFGQKTRPHALTVFGNSKFDTPMLDGEKANARHQPSAANRLVARSGGQKEDGIKHWVSV